jgi:hypothetical protein
MLSPYPFPFKGYPGSSHESRGISGRLVATVACPSRLFGHMLERSIRKLDECIALFTSTQGTDSGCSTCLPREVTLFSLGNREESL